MQLASTLWSPLDDEPYYAAREASTSNVRFAAADSQRQLSGNSIAAARADKLAKVRLLEMCRIG